MKLSFEIYTSKVTECKEFYTQHFDFSVKLAIEGFAVLQHKTNTHYELMFCIPQSPFVHPIFHPEFNGKGALLQMEVDNVVAAHDRLRDIGIQMVLPLTNDPVNGHHFTIQDPSGLLVDIVQYD